jgi:hypothetical protein
MNIKEFKKGDAVVRVEPTPTTGKYYSPFTQTVEEHGGDRSYIGEKLTFIGIANGCAYFDRAEDSFMTKLSGNKRMDLRLVEFSEGWEYWQDVDSLDESDSNIGIKYDFKKRIEEAIENEDYELIKELKDMLDKSLAK